MNNIKLPIQCLLLLLIVMTSCSAKKSEEEEKLSHIKSEVIVVHDAAMTKMGDIMKLSKELKTIQDSTADSVAFQNIERHIQDLNAAHEGMMTWMRSFSEKFPAGTLLESETDHSTHEGDHQSEGHEMKEGSSLYQSLEQELVKIKNVEGDIDLAIENGQLLVKSSQK